MKIKQWQKRHIHCAIFRGKNPHKGKALNIQNLPYFWNTKTHVVFFFSFHAKKCPGLCRHRPEHSLGKKIFAWNEKWKKLCGFSYSKSMANFEYLRLCLYGDFCLLKSHSDTCFKNYITIIVWIWRMMIFDR